jgi:hypothetical protein
VLRVLGVSLQLQSQNTVYIVLFFKRNLRGTSVTFVSDPSRFVSHRSVTFCIGGTAGTALAARTAVTVTRTRVTMRSNAMASGEVTVQTSLHLSSTCIDPVGRQLLC